MISNKYKIIEKIKDGSFGSIFKCENIRTNEFVAIKFETKDTNKKTLKNEAKIYQYLGRTDGFPQLKMFGSFGNHNYLAIELLGVPLSKLIIHYKSFSLKTVLLLGKQIIQRIQTLHENQLLHRDIKPDNFLFGLDTTTNKLFLIDFGFSKRYNYDGIHIPEKKISNIIGTSNFVSLNVHNYIEPSRRDDIESCIYVFLNMLLGKLQWFDKTNLTEIYLLKRNIITIPEIPSFIKIMLNYIRHINFDETPDYAYIINLIDNVMLENNYDNDYEWN